MTVLDVLVSETNTWHLCCSWTLLLPLWMFQVDFGKHCNLLVKKCYLFLYIKFISTGQELSDVQTQSERDHIIILM